MPCPHALDSVHVPFAPFAKILRRAGAILTALALSLQSLLIQPAPALAHVPDFPVPLGHFYTQARGQGSESLTGFTIADVDGIPFWSEYKRLGGIRSLGYPASRRFIWNGWAAQVVQKGIMVWHPEAAPARAQLAHVLDDLSSAGFDDWLREFKSIPAPFDPNEERDLDYAAVQTRRLKFLDGNAPVKQRFMAERNWLDLYGLPVSFDESEQAWVLRAQRVVFQYWKVDVPWARQGTVTIAHGGDLAKEAGLLPGDVLEPERPTVYRAENPEQPRRMVIPKLRIDAPVAIFGLDQLEKDGSLPAPKRAEEVAWYDYSGRAGEANNAVFAGHVDWLGRAAVFTRVKELVDGDQIILMGDGGTKFTYEVLGCNDVECHLPMSSRSDVDEFIGYSAFSHLTLITCEGQWDVIRKDYSHRRIVRARLVAVSTEKDDPLPVVAEPLPYDYWVFTADAPDLPRDAEGNPLR